MKRLIRLFLCLQLLVFATSINAQVTIGYTNGNFNKRDGIHCGSTLKQGMAIKLSKEKLQLLKGRKITGIRAAFCTKYVEDLEFFITESLENDKAIYKQPSTGATTNWADFSFSTPYAITGDKDLYIGFTSNVQKGYSALSFDRSADSQGLSWIYEDDKWIDAYGKGYGSANLQLLLDGANSFIDLTLKTIQLNGFYKVGTPCIYSGEVFNFGTKTINSLDIVCQVGNEEPTTLSLKDLNLESNNTYDFNLPEYTSQNSGDLPVKISISKINGEQQDADLTDNNNEINTFIYPATTEKRLLLESFTGQECSNCPAGHRIIESVTKGLENEIILIAHHSGYQPDSFTMKEDWDYCWFYNNGGSIYAPAAMINRMQNPDIGTPGPVFSLSNANSINSTIAKCREIQPYVSVDIISEFNNDTRELTAKVYVYTHVVPEGEQFALNLFIVQDSIIARQVGGGDEYIHNHVFRGSLTGYYGYEIGLQKGQRSVKEFTYVLPDAIMSTYEGEESKSIPTVLKDMHLVAFVSAYSDNNPNGCLILNSNTTTFGGETSGSGIAETSAEDNLANVYADGNLVHIVGKYDKADVYDMAAHLVKTVGNNTESFVLNRGFYVIRIMQEGKVISRKLMVY